MQKATPVIAIFDVGKTNKKLFLFDENYRIVYEKSARFAETTDEDGFPCENLESLRLSVFDSLMEVLRKKEFVLKGINFSTYGASFVYLDEEGRPLAPLYNYLKAYPQALQDRFYDTYGGSEHFSLRAASPVLGSLNSGMQLYRIKYENPELFNRIRYALHLPQYLSHLISGSYYSDITSIGCHTNLWDFHKNDYQDWVQKEGILEKLPPIRSSQEVLPASFPGTNYPTGIGLHDSSAALIPYLVNFHEPFVLISTGTWCISLNPFNQSPLSLEELANDCLCYMNYQGKPVIASRLFAGYEHEQQVKRIATHFNQGTARYRQIRYDPEIMARLPKNKPSPLQEGQEAKIELGRFGQRDLSLFSSGEEAYHQLLLDLVVEQVKSTRMVLKNTAAKRIFVDGGFSKNMVYMNLLALFFPEMEVFAASMAQATAAGAALAIHRAWNPKPLPTNIIKLKLYAVTHNAIL
jgi:sugar (pentulose or hexulose) kinase